VTIAIRVGGQTLVDLAIAVIVLAIAKLRGSRIDRGVMIIAISNV